jgi:hypothetical protein
MNNEETGDTEDAAADVGAEAESQPVESLTDFIDRMDRVAFMRVLDLHRLPRRAGWSSAE